jgi:hypothetical protein
MENLGVKGHAFDQLEVGETKTLLDVAGSGMIRRLWMTLNPRTPRVLRGLRLDMYWDGAATPAVSVPLGDFFGWNMGLQPAAFENELFSTPEAKSFVAYPPMPFRKGARITLTNESPQRLMHVFYDINFTLGDQHAADVLYFHAAWRRERWTALGTDFQILPKIEGHGRFLGCHLGVIGNPKIRGWWGEGEVKAYLDGDDRFPTLAGTGAEDYVGTGWGLGVFARRYQGCLVSDEKNRHWSLYRYHIPDPVNFERACRVTLQQIGGGGKADVAAMVKEGAPVRPISLNETGGTGRFFKFLELPQPVSLEDNSLPDGWVNFLREDDLSATAMFYLNAPANDLPPIATVEKRLEDIPE